MSERAGTQAQTPADERTQLIKAGFVQVADDVYVNVRHIESVTVGQSVHLISGRRLPLPRGYKVIGADLLEAIASTAPSA